MADYPYPDEPTTVKSYQADVAALYAKYQQPFPNSPDAFRWFSRYGYSCRHMPEPEARAKHLAECEAALSGVPPEPPTPGENHNRLFGALTRHGRVVTDETGPRILMYCHFMEAFSAWCHGREQEVYEQCRVIAAHYAGIRTLDVLGYWDVAWAGKEVTPVAFLNHAGEPVSATPHYWHRKRDFVTMLHDLGVRILDDRGDLNSWSRENKLEHMRVNGTFYRGLGFGHEVLGGVWAANEGWQNGLDNIDLGIAMLHSFTEGAGWLPALRGISAPGGDSDPARLAACNPPQSYWEPEMPCSFVNWSSDPANVLTIHGNRGAHEHIIEHYWGYGYDQTMRNTGKVAFNTEPVGPGRGVSVGQVNDPELLCGLTAGALIGGQAWTYMSGYGVFWDGRIESQPGFAEVARLPQLLHQDVASWPTVCHGGTRWAGTRILAANDPTRCDHAIAEDGRFAIVVHTQEAAGRPLQCERACAEFTVTNMLTLQVEQAGPMHVGQHYTHPGVARLVTGRLA